jgi:hypothetical protein
VKADVRKPADAVEREFPDWFWDAIAVEQEQEVLANAMAKLRAEGGATLTEPECMALRRWIKEHSAKKKRRRGRPSADAIEIALFCRMSEAFMSTKAAVKDIADWYGVSRASVYAARRKYSLSK